MHYKVVYDKILYIKYKRFIMCKDNLVVKHNSLIKSRYDYTISELRLIITVASMIKADDKNFKDYEIIVKDYAELLNSKTKESLYRDLKKLGKKLLSQPLEIEKENGFLICNWFSSYEYAAREGKIICSFDPKLKPYLLELQEQFTKYKLENILMMKSTYSIRLYELAKSWQKIGYFEMDIKEFRISIGANNIYPLYANLKQKAINVAIKEINNFTDISLKFIEIKTSRKITKIRFEIKKNRNKYSGFLKSEKAFINYMRANFINAVVWNGIAQDEKKRELSIDPQGRLYDKLGKSYNATQSKEMWTWLYALAKDDSLPILKDI
jgi:plasmid replication initiation protein